MARNEEKAQSMLNRYLAGKQAEARPEKARRPYLASECHDLDEADKWRHQILREVGRKVMEIQNAGLGEHRLRDLNDEINKLLREKVHWERRIVELGGPDFSKSAPKATDSEGRPLEGAAGRGAGYRYFGAAKELPGVKELFEKPAAAPVRRTRAELSRRVNADYYGLRDEDDGVLLREESAAEPKRQRKLLEDWAERQAGSEVGDGAADGGQAPDDRTEAGATAGPSAGEGDDSGGAASLIAHVPLPDSAIIEQRILEAKKKVLLERYTSPALQASQGNTAKLLGKG